MTHPIRLEVFEGQNMDQDGVVVKRECLIVEFVINSRKFDDCSYYFTRFNLLQQNVIKTSWSQFSWAQQIICAQHRNTFLK